MTPAGTKSRSVHPLRSNPESLGLSVRKRPYYTKKSRRPSLQGKSKSSGFTLSNYPKYSQIKPKSASGEVTLARTGSRTTSTNSDPGADIMLMELSANSNKDTENDVTESANMKERPSTGIDI